MKKVISEIFVCMLLVGTLFVIGPEPVSAADLWDDGFFYTVSDGNATITGYNGTGGVITIPDTMEGIYPTVAINHSAFDSIEGHTITSVIIPDSVKTIGNEAFINCHLASVIIGNNVTTIGYSAFFYCQDLESVIIGNHVNIIEHHAFYGCSSLESVDIPDSVTTIEDYTFYGCSAMTSVTIGNSVTVIGEAAFYGCPFPTSLNIPNSVIMIGSQAFFYWTRLTSVTIGNNVTTIGDSAFGRCSSLTTIDVSVDNKYYASKDDVLYNHNITTLRLYPGGKTGAFAIPSTVTTIGSQAFFSCELLVSVIIPNSVTTIDRFAFSCCSALKSMAIPNSVTTIGDNAFSNCYALTSVTIGNNVTTIGWSAFSGCSTLISVTIPNNVISIEDELFSHCSHLTSIIIGNNVTTIGKSIFSYSTNLTSIIFLGHKAPTQVGENWITNTSEEIIGHAYANSDFYEPNLGGIWHELKMGAEIFTLTLTISGTGSGIIETSPNRPYQYNESTVTIWANASTGSTFTGFTGGLSGKTTPQTLFIDGNKTVNAVFTKSSSGGDGGDGGDSDETPNTPPTANYSYSPLTPMINETIQFTDNSTDSDGTIASWSWTLGDGTTSTSKNPQHNYSTPGQYTIVLEVTDNDGAKKSTSKILTIAQIEQPNNQPTADFTLTPTSAKTNETIQFTDTSQDTDGTITSYLWSFGDGATSASQNPQHRYTTNGTYSITLEITDNDGGTDSNSKPIVIHKDSTDTNGNKGTPGFELVIALGAIAFVLFCIRKSKKYN